MPQLKLYEHDGIEYFEVDDTYDPTADDVAAAFSETIFWNYGLPWPGDRSRDPEFPLTASLSTPADPDERWLVSSLGWEGGEVSINVATMRPIRKGEDRESGITTDEVMFIANLPVYIPVLLATIDRLRGALREAVGYLDNGVPVACSRCGAPSASCDADCEKAARFKAAREKWVAMLPDSAGRVVSA